MTHHTCDHCNLAIEPAGRLKLVVTGMELFVS